MEKKKETNYINCLQAQSKSNPPLPPLPSYPLNSSTAIAIPHYDALSYSFLMFNIFICLASSFVPRRSPPLEHFEMNSFVNFSILQDSTMFIFLPQLPYSCESPSHALKMIHCLIIAFNLFSN